MNTYNRNERSGGNNYGNKSGGRSSTGRNFGGRDGGRDRERPEMHSAVCSRCGNTCEVPFKPTGEKPVYCSNCYKIMNDGDSRNDRRPERSAGRNFERPSFNRADREMFSAVCDTCGKDCKVPFRPSGGKPVYCSEHYDKSDRDSGSRNRSSGGQDNNRVLEEIVKLNQKLDKLLSSMEPKVISEVKVIKELPVKAAKSVTPEKKVVAKKPVVKKKVTKTLKSAVSKKKK